MELRLFASLAPLLCACASTVPKRLVIPEEMRRPLAAGQSATAPAAPPVRARPAIADPFATVPTDDMTGTKPAPPVPASPAPAPTTPGGPAAATPTPVAGAAPAKPTALPVKPPAPRAQPPILESQRYTLRLVERGRVWEVELPESTGGYEVRIPLGPGIETPTAADQEMLGKTPPEGRSKSYLATLAKLGEMYSSHRYELALIEVVDLEQQYPKDARLQAMKGSLYQKLGKSGLAREAWKKSLEFDPTDATVAEALRALKEE
jgi:hypothetical protein